MYHHKILAEIDKYIPIEIIYDEEIYDDKKTKNDKDN